VASNSIEEALHYHLVNDATVIAEVGTRIYWLEAPQGATKPFVTYFVVDDPFSPLAFGRDDAGHARVQFNIFDKNRTEALRIGDIVRDSLDQHSGDVDGVTVVYIMCSGTHGMKVPGQNIYMATFDAMCRYDDI